MSMTTLGNITSANASAVLTVEELYPSGVVLEQFATDQSIGMEEITLAQTRMGVDGHMAAGYTPSILPVHIMLEASSPSMEALSQLARAMKQARAIYQCTLTVRVPAISKTYTWTGGVLKSGKLFPDAKKTLDPTFWRFHFADMQVSSL